MKNRDEMSDIMIRKAVPDDAKGMLNVFYKTWLATYPNKRHKISIEDIKHRFKGRFSKKAIAKRKAGIAHPKKGEHDFVALDKERIVGICIIILHPDKNQLQAIYVLPEFQGIGIGKLLWNTVQPLFKKKNTIVHVATFNKNAKGFYKKLGFIDTGKRFKDEKYRFKSGSIIPEMEMILKKSEVGK